MEMEPPGGINEAHPEDVSDARIESALTSVGQMLTKPSERTVGLNFFSIGFFHRKPERAATCRLARDAAAVARLFFLRALVYPVPVHLRAREDFRRGNHGDTMCRKPTEINHNNTAETLQDEH
ncbi:hypothetical protein [Herbaspirillum hiltneri]|uniref:hypothetical protein n=1 Tax=Herbaspirillum hiltneri TaxID=341045 RepID=UPI000A6FC54B|nr:hypothetical protein [Herbaspirillum hiltneri]